MIVGPWDLCDVSLEGNAESSHKNVINSVTQNVMSLQEIVTEINITIVQFLLKSNNKIKTLFQGISPFFFHVLVLTVNICLSALFAKNKGTRYIFI